MSAPFPLPVKERCYFCDIINGESSGWNLLYASELSLVMLNGRQFEQGQCVVLPRRHAPTLLDMDQAELAAVMSDAQRTARAMVELLAPEGVLLYQNNGVGSGQEVPHFHLHVVPRRSGSDWGLGPPHLARLEQNDRPPAFDHEVVTADKQEMAALLRAYFDRKPTT